MPFDSSSISTSLLLSAKDRARSPNSAQRYRSSAAPVKIGTEIGKRLHHFECRGPQVVQPFALLVFLVKGLPGAEFKLDFLVGRQGFALAKAKAAGGLALGHAVVGDAMLCHQAGGGAGDGASRVAERRGGGLASRHDEAGAGGIADGRIRTIIPRNRFMHIHIIGICGTFMGGVALLARAAGHRVTGCDANVYPPMSTQLEEQGIELVSGYDVAQLSLEPDLFVVGNAISRGNPLLEAVLERNLAYVSGPQWLARTSFGDAGCWGWRERTARPPPRHC
jgi:hypothetical protein